MPGVPLTPGNDLLSQVRLPEPPWGAGRHHVRATPRIPTTTVKPERRRRVLLHTVGLATHPDKAHPGGARPD